MDERSSVYRLFLLVSPFAFGGGQYADYGETAQPLLRGLRDARCDFARLQRLRFGLGHLNLS
jgi:hypothetical protein